ncbi:polysaccharide biosynthesis tyrosine autokinase [Armatimonas sp.]|uniref:polysaccharide biosynthesis tyrosine autokinase n=1 Tax=Armatimonas sp. TaxID=1872638 RepID=UPI00286D23DB|nr:polysaccharide biosynthesis tyrosine autokinase [Armatimonas sp.]
MDFWRIWRLINRRIYLVIGLALIAAVLVVIGIFIQNQRAGVIADARLNLQQAMPSVATNGNGESTAVSSDSSSKRISELATQLANNNNTFLNTANLLRMNEEARKKEVYAILDRNQYFAPYDSQIEDKVDQLVREGELPPAQRQAQLEQQKRDFRLAEVARLAAPRDRLGAFAQDGLKLEASEIADNLRQFVDVKPVISLLDTESSRQFDNQIQLLGHFPRENEALLYLNMLCVAFLDNYAVTAQGSTRVAIARLLRQKDETDRLRQSAINAMSVFKRKSKLASLIGQETTGQTSQALEGRIADLESNRDAAEQTFNNAVQNAAQTKPTITVTLPAAENPQYKTAKLDVEKWSIDVKRLSATKGENDPDLQTVRAALNQATAQAKANYKPWTQSQPNPNYLSAQSTLSMARGQFAATKAALSAQQKQYKELMDRLAKQPALQAEYSKLAREIEGLDKNLARINQELQNARLENIQTSRAGTIQITRAYVLPSKNTMANGIKLLLYATVLALILGIALVIGLDALDNSVRTKKDAEELFGLPVAGEIPAQLPDPRRAPRVAYLDPLSPTAESYRLLRTDILFTQIEHPFRSLLIATVKPGQGATTTATNLAITLAQAGKKVILVDADLRHPSLHGVFSLPNEKGLTTILAGASLAIDEVLQRTEIESLLVMTSGSPPLNPSELVGSPQMRELHERLKAVADIVIYDAPSVITFSDASIMASFMDATMLVIRAGDVPRGAVEQVKGMLVKANANLIGVVLNAAPSESVDSVHYHNQYYPRLKPTENTPASDRGSSYTALEEEERFERLTSDFESDDNDDDDDVDFLTSRPAPSLRNPGIVEEQVAPKPVVVPDAPSAPVIPQTVVIPQPPIVVAEPPKPVEPPQPIQVFKPEVIIAPEVHPAPIVAPPWPTIAVAKPVMPPPAPVIEPPKAVVVELSKPVELPKPVVEELPKPPTIIIPAPPVSPSEPPKASEPLKTNWSTSPIVGSIDTPLARSVELPNLARQESSAVKTDDDDVISFDFDAEDDEYLNEFDNDFDDEFDSDYDDDYGDEDEGKHRSKAKAAGLGGILNWFKRGRS